MALDWSQIRVTLSNERFNYSTGPRFFQSKEWFRHSLVDYDLWYCTMGKGILHLPSREKIPLQRGSLVLFRPGMECECDSPPDYPPLCMYFFHFDLLDIHTNQRIPEKSLDHIPVVMQRTDGSFIESVCERIFTRLNSIQHQATPDFVKQATLDIANTLFRSLLMDIELGDSVEPLLNHPNMNRTHYKMIMDIRAEIYNNPTRYQNVRELAKAYSCTPDHFTRTFKSILGVSPNQVLIDSRIQRAKLLLLNHISSTSEIAFSLGYNNPYFFYRQFKKQTGSTPTEFRMIHANRSKSVLERNATATSSALVPPDDSGTVRGSLRKLSGIGSGNNDRWQTRRQKPLP